MASILTAINGKKLYYRNIGDPNKPPIIFIHGLGMTSEVFTPLINALNLTESHSLHLLDLEGHGLSPASSPSMSVASYAADLVAIASSANVSSATVIGHSMGGHIALTLALQRPKLVKTLILLGTPCVPVSDFSRNSLHQRASAAPLHGMPAVVDQLITNGLSKRSKRDNQTAVAAIRWCILGQDPEAYSKACLALATSPPLQVQDIVARTLILTGDEDIVSTLPMCEEYQGLIFGSKLVVLKECGHWYQLEDLNGLCNAVQPFLFDA